MLTSDHPNTPNHEHNSRISDGRLPARNEAGHRTSHPAEEPSQTGVGRGRALLLVRPGNVATLSDVAAAILRPTLIW